MNLKRIELKGFKSFAERTTIEFKKGVTCIVGPNGCGKSNIIDAIRWVLGEQKTQSLRARKMEDVIFGGTIHRPAQNIAEVSLYLDDPEQFFQRDTSELCIKRILHRSGESHYYINGELVRLKDVRELLMDSGIGISGYSLISQGDIEDILKDSKFNRRRIFEEASGISLFDFKKTEAERRLQRIEEHLIRLQDIYQELDSRLLPLKEASEKATLYLSLREEIKRAEIYFLLSDYDRYQEEISSFTRELQQLKKELLTNEEEIEGHRHSRIKHQQDLERERTQLDAIQKLFQEKRKEREEAHLNLRLMEEQLLQSERRRSEIEEALRQNEEQQSHVARDTLLLQEQLVGKESRLSLQKDDLSFLARQLEEKRVRLDRHGQLRAQREQRMQELKLQSEKSSSTVELLKDQREQLQGEKTALLQEQRELKVARRRQEDLEMEQMERIDELSTRISEEENRQLMNDTTLQGLSEELIRLQQDLSWTLFDAERVTRDIRLIESSEEGENPERFQEWQETFGPAMKGLLIEFISPEPGYEKALEGALKGRLHSLLIEGHNLNFIREGLKDTGRTTLLMASSSPKVPPLQGSLGLLSSMVQIQSKEKDRILPLLQGIHVVTNVTEEIISEHPGDIVSLSGDYYRYPGSLHLYGTIEEDTLFSRRTDLVKRLGDLQRVQQDQENQILLLQEHSDITHSLQETVAQALQGCQDELTNLLEQKQQIQQQKAILLFQEHQLKDSLLSREAQWEDLSKRLEREQAQFSEQQEQLKALSTETSEPSELLPSEEEYREEMRLYTDRRIETARLEEEFIAFQGHYRNLDAQLKKETQAMEQLEEKRQSNRQEIKEMKNSLDRMREDQEERKKVLHTYEEQILLLEERAQVKDQEIQSIGEHLEAWQEKRGKLQEALSQREVQHARLEERQQSLEDELWSKYEMSIFQAKSHSSEESCSIQRKQLREKQLELIALEPVNLAAPNEYRELKERHQFLSEQLKDMKESRRDIQQTIQNLEQTMISEFKRTFQEIQGHFDHVFKELFQGGEGSISLEDEENILESDIRIMASPPGKKLQHMNLLSGGEKALTAIALLFSVLRSRPAPFYVLDEIEAALDDFNIQRFGTFLTQFSHGSQFILITHRRGTMEYAQALYGVSMEEKGISRTISLNLERKSDDQRLLQ